VIAALLLALLMQGAPLELDPRTLPHAQQARWKDFDPAHLRPEELPPGMLTVKRALETGDYPRALSALQEVLRQAPDFPPAWHQLGVLYFKLQRYGDGAACLERYLAIAPQRVGDTRVLAHCYYSLGRFEEARAQYERVLAVHPQEVEALRGHALALMRLAQSEPALAELERVLVLSPEHVEAYEWKAQILYEEERLEPALAAALRARELDAYSARAWFLVGRICGELGRTSEAEAANRRFQELNTLAGDLRQVEGDLLYKPDDVALLEQLARLRARTGDRSRTRADLARLFAVAPAALELRLFGLDLLESLGDFDAARLVAQKLEQLGAENAATWKRLELFYAHAQDRAKEVQAGERFRRLSGK